MKQYQDLIRQILKEGVLKPSARDGMPPSISIFGAMMKFDLANGFPLLTVKKMNFAKIVPEVIWMLNGKTNIKPLVDQNCNIWNKDAYRWYLTKIKRGEIKIDGSSKILSQEEFVDHVKNMPTDGVHNKPFDPSMPYTIGDLGKIYGYQWRNQNGEIDQVADLIKSLIDQPNSRYHIIDAWNKKEMPEMGLPPCHLLYQFYLRPVAPSEHHLIDKGMKYHLDMLMYQRSCDTFLGVPYDLVLGGLMMLIIGSIVNAKPGIFTWIGGDVHLYEDHIEQAKEVLTRAPHKLPAVVLYRDLYSIDDLSTLRPQHFGLINYTSHPYIHANLSVGNPA